MTDTPGAEVAASQAAQPTRSCCAGGATADADAMAEFAEYMAERREKAEQERAAATDGA